MVEGRAKSEKILDRCLEASRSGGQDPKEILRRQPEQAEALRPELEAASWLHEKRQGFVAQPDFAQYSAQRLLAGLHKPGLSLRQRFLAWKDGQLGRQLFWNNPLLQAASLVMLGFALYFSLGSIGRASQFWLPGDVFYPIKTVQESAQLTLAVRAAEDASLHIEFAHRRLLEVQSLAMEERHAQIPRTVENFRWHVESAVRAVRRVAARDPRQGQVLAEALQGVLSEQVDLMRLLASLAPLESQVEFNRVRFISQDGLSRIRDFLFPDEDAPDGGARDSLQFCWVGAVGVT